MKSKIFFRYLAAISILLLGLIYACLAALDACAKGACWDGIGLHLSFSLVAVGLGCTQILPLAFSLVALVASWALLCCRFPEEDGEEKEDFGFCVHVTLAVPFIFTSLTVGLSFGGLFCLKACAIGECCPRLSSHSALAMCLSGQILNFVVAISCYLAAAKLEGSKALRSVCDFWSTKRRRRVCADTALPA